MDLVEEDISVNIIVNIMLSFCQKIPLKPTHWTFDLHHLTAVQIRGRQGNALPLLSSQCGLSSTGCSCCLLFIEADQLNLVVSDFLALVEAFHTASLKDVNQLMDEQCLTCLFMFLFLLFPPALSTGGYAGPVQGAYGKKFTDRGDPPAAIQWYK